MVQALRMPADVQLSDVRSVIKGIIAEAERQLTNNPKATCAGFDMSTSPHVPTTGELVLATLSQVRLIEFVDPRYLKPAHRAYAISRSQLEHLKQIVAR